MNSFENGVLRNFSIGGFLGAVLGVCFIIAIEAELSDEYTKYWTYGISALVALLGSGIAVAGVLTSIANQNRIFDETRKKSLLASKALLPLALSRFHEIAENGTGIALEEEIFLNDPDNSDIVRSRLEIDEATVGVLKECIELSDEVTRKWMTTIFSRYQVARSRTIGQVSDRHRLLIDSVRGDLAYDLEVIRAMVAHLFDYARDIGNRISPSEQIDLETIRISISHPSYASARYVSAQSRIEERRAALGDGSIENFSLGD
ncbi:hypothetical protein [Shimia abyssi]|uniref:Uncharacterized protein n=1 Tax=Shimia abyssi TaxID=1662395 RepID=A0A2P8FDB1_9RHOB|nr:hypothetical protein [Shimia abyssi]PSL19712.1 hypothetical protein CLV88_105135 [Shimia abyssi]